MAASWPNLTRSDASAVELIVRIVHLVNTKDGLKAAFVEGFIVGHERQTGYLRFYLPPHFREYGCIFHICGTQAMHAATPVVVIRRFGLDERIELVDYLTATNDNHANGTNG